VGVSGDPAAVEVTLTSGDRLEVGVAGLDAQHALIEALGFGLAHRRIPLRLGGPRAPLAASCGGIAAGA